ncbi:PREDICTED: exocyst complex component EXO70A1-like [Nicotiana attenuata]|uniref:Exocyst subunit Exo70 family protein n=1 Tax=Nicotiana attenuata TaxID=49451 RepID=A0A1J6IQF7_NICAT|nr:PREDICTED: exocyst complex component EXO70A1-like [Nicotiana attenuata]OIT07078.1 exocyst complex component exo70a1 [Nicotiana attenuata]
MPRKGMRTLNWFSPKHLTTDSTSPSTSQFSSPSRFGFSPSRPSFSEAVIDRTLEMAEPIIMKWDPDTTTFAKVTSLFYENRREAKDFIKCVHNLQKAMHFHSTENSRSDKLVRAQSLMQIAMKRLQKEFYQILSINRAHLDPESISTVSSGTSTRSSISDFDVEDDDDRVIGGESISEVEDFSNIVMADLRLIAECMISSGYAKECLNIYKVIRKSSIDEGIYRLGVEKLSSSQVHKMDWEVVDLKIKDWLNAVDVAVKTLFNGERILCDHVFASNDAIRELCFTEISKDGAMILFSFPENVARNSKKSPEKVFRLLYMYTAIAGYWPEIEVIFSFESESVIRSQALTSLVKLGESIRTALAEFETALQKESSKTPVAGGGIHPLTVDAMNYIILLADYSNILSDILAEAPPSAKRSLPESFFGIADSDESPAPAISLRFAWLILILLCKLDGKAKHYKDVSLAYLFLANNLQYIVVKVRSSNLKYLLGENWISKREGKIKQFASNYERLGWSHVIESLPQEPNATMAPQQVKEIFKKFNSSFEQAHRKQSVCVVPNSKLRDNLKASIARKIFPVYREFYNTHKHMIARERHSSHMIRFSPEDVGHYLSDLFFGPIESGSSSSVESSPSRTIPSRLR